MRKKLFTIMCVLMLLAISLAGFVGCVVDNIIIPSIDDPVVPDPGGTDKPIEPSQVTFYFTPIIYEGDRYNGESGVGSDIYIADLKAQVKVSEGTCMANITIKSVTITLQVNGVKQLPRLATTAELAKFKLSQAVIKNITTVDSEIAVKVRFGDFSNSMYYGASFNFELQADPYIE